MSFKRENSVHLITGCMYSRKSSTLLPAIERYDYISCAKVFLLKPACDTRDDSEDNTTSRLNISRKVDARIKTGQDAWEYIEREILKCSSEKKIIVVAIDEAQFVENLDWFVRKVLSNSNSYTIITYIAALDSTFEAKMWNEIVKIIPYCTEITKLTAICGICQHNTGILTRRIGDSNNLIEIENSGESKYVASCFQCFEKKL